MRGRTKKDEYHTAKQNAQNQGARDIALWICDFRSEATCSDSATSANGRTQCEAALKRMNITLQNRTPRIKARGILRCGSVTSDRRRHVLTPRPLQTAEPNARPH